MYQNQDKLSLMGEVEHLKDPPKCPDVQPSTLSALMSSSVLILLTLFSTHSCSRETDLSHPSAIYK
jgi:hypothetical protein